MVARPQDRKRARAACGEGVTVSELPIDDSWMRDSGPIFVLDGAGRRAGVDFGFNAWGEKFEPYADDAEVTRAAARAAGGGAHRRARLHPRGRLDRRRRRGHADHHRAVPAAPEAQPGALKDEIARRLQDELGVHTVVWLGQGLVEDHDTDGHVDNICAFDRARARAAPDGGRRGNPNWSTTRENAERLQAAGLEVVELPLLPYVDHDGPPTVVPYTNFYICNGALIVPVAGQETDDEALALLGGLYPGREVVPVAGHDARPGRRRGPLHHAAGPRRRLSV